MTRTPQDAGGKAKGKKKPFCIRVVRLLTSAAIATELGPEVCWLLAVIAHTQDARHYAGAVNFWNEQLAPLCGCASVGRLIRTRARAIEAGWLEYEAGGKGKAGRYRVLIPAEYASIPDSPTDESGEMPSGCTSKMEGENETETVSPSKMRGKPERQTEGSASASDNLPTCTYTETYSSCPDQGPDGQKGSKRRTREPSFLPDDLAAARWIWERIEQMQPGRRRPDLDKWANTIRLMREQDGRTCDQIRALFGRVQADDFWRLNILSPDKLRAKWDDLTLKLRPDKSSKQQPAPSIYKPLRPLDDD